MARLQILELPEGTSDDRPPFVLIVDQASEATVHGFDDPSAGASIAERIGARHILVFAETVEIPANEVLPSPAETFELRGRAEGAF